MKELTDLSQIVQSSFDLIAVEIKNLSNTTAPLQSSDTKDRKLSLPTLKDKRFSLTSENSSRYTKSTYDAIRIVQLQNIWTF